MNTSRRAAAFTLIELLVVVVIITILISILIPVISKVRQSAYATNTGAVVQSLTGAIQQYQQTFSAYPGPLADNQLYPNSTLIAGIPASAVYDVTPTLLQNVTGTENLVLGLMGGLQPRNPPGPGWQFNRDIVGNGPRSLNPSSPKKFNGFLSGVQLTERPDTAPSAVQYGKYKDNSGEASDSNIPELLDRFPIPMPILYLRARVGAGGVVSIAGRDSANAPVIGLDASNNPIPTQYDLNYILPYTNTTIGEGKNLDTYYQGNISSPQYPGGSLTPYHGLKTVNLNAVMTPAAANYFIPADAFPYFRNDALSNPGPDGNWGTADDVPVPRQKDAYILISAGKDRVYGTEDDITSFGAVFPPK